ncbi:hypothetical protein Anas_02099 [Armadillidium nasatum]|uniref:Uncharacterized protein n=1 Tax=Armadillidium nasatum TaxID=96803 RepID=A0A5N5TMQ6_9CRUS|nr:hypothetical protein Anas_02099 [Armadillidium nasatum]
MTSKGQKNLRTEIPLSYSYNCKYVKNDIHNVLIVNFCCKGIKLALAVSHMKSYRRHARGKILRSMEQSAYLSIIKLLIWTYFIPVVIIIYICILLQLCANKILIVDKSTINTCDDPPSYQEAVENPPPYNLLKYYWCSIRSSPSRWSTRTIAIIRDPLDPFEDLEIGNIQELYSAKFKRYPSSPY